MIQYGYNPAMKVGGPKCGIHNNRVRQPDRSSAKITVFDNFSPAPADSLKVRQLSWWLKSYLFIKKAFSWKR